IERLNVMAAIFTALGAGVLVLVANELFSFWMPERVRRVTGKGQRVKGGTRIDTKKKEVVKQSVEENPLPITRYPLPAAIAVGLAAAFSATWWSQSTSIEV